jgi:hypothetical protein
VTFPLPPQAVEASQSVGHLFPVITPSRAATPPAAVTPSPAAAAPGPATRVRHQLPARDQELALSESLTGSTQAGWILALLAAAGAVAWLLLVKVRKRRVP